MQAAISDCDVAFTVLLVVAMTETVPALKFAE